MDKKIISAVMKELGRRGGVAAGKTRKDKIPAERRKEIAQAAAKASAKVRREKAQAKRISLLES